MDIKDKSKNSNEYDTNLDLDQENHLASTDSDELDLNDALDNTGSNGDSDELDWDVDSDALDSNFNSIKINQNDIRKNKNNLSLGNIIRYLIMTIAAIVFLYSGFMLAKIYLEYKQGDDIYKSIASSVLVPIETTTTTSDDIQDVQSPFKYNHEALLSINPEGIGYLYIPSINLKLPLAQGSDNDYYLTHAFNRTYNGGGALFEDYRISNGLSASHVIIYGHNMKNGSMFAGLSKYLTPSFYQTQGNDTFYIYTENKLLEYKIFTAYISEPISNTYTYNFTNASALQEYAKSMKQLSNYNTSVDVSSATQIVTFSTCTSDGTQRIIVQGTFMSETPLE